MDDIIHSINAGKSEILEQVKAGKPGPKRPYKPRPSALSEKLRAANAAASAAAAAAAAAAAPAKGAGAGRGSTPAPGGAAGGASGASTAAATIGQRLKTVLEELKRTREILSRDELKARISLDVAGDEELLRELARHPNVECIADQLRYRPKTPGIHHREDLLRYLRQMSTVEGAGEKGMVGVKLVQLDDAYPGVEDDIKALHKEGRVFKFDHTNIAADTVLFYNETDPTLGLGVKTSPAVVNLFRDAEIPAHVRDLELEVVKSGLRSLIGNRPKLEKLATDPKDKKKRKREVRINIAKATNAHLPSLFEGAQPTEIDRRQ